MKDFLYSLGLSLLAVFAPLKPMLMTTLALVIIDFIFGIMAAKKKKQKITSKRMRESGPKLLVFNVLLITSFLVETYMTGDTFPAVKIVSAFIGVVELTSIVESLNTLSGGTMLKSLVEKLTAKSKDV